MKAHEAERLIATIRELVDEGNQGAKGKVPSIPLGQPVKAAPIPPAAMVDGADLELPATRDGRVKLTADVIEALYLRFKNRLLDDLRIDPVFVQLVAHAPEIEIGIQPRIVNLDGATLKGRVALLVARGWMDDMRTTSDVRKELARTGSDPGGGGTLSDTLGTFVRDGFLVRDAGGYRRAPSLKITERRIEA